MKLEGIAPDKGVGNKEELASVQAQLERQTSYNGGSFGKWAKAFAEIDKEIDTRKTVLLCDEISWMGKFDATFPGELKVAWDNLFKKHERLIVFLCGSVSNWISENILNNTAFVGRASLNMVVRELPFEQCAKFWGQKVDRTAVRDNKDILADALAERYETQV